MSRLVFQPMIGATLWITLAVLAAAALVWYARSRPGAVSRSKWRAIVVLSALGIAGVLLLLLNPTWQEPIPPPAGKPVLSVLIDQSASMAVRDAEKGATRFVAASQMAAQFEKALGDRYDVRLQTFGETTSPVSTEELAAASADQNGSDFTQAIVSSLAQDHPQGQMLLLLSDGVDNGPGGIQSLRNALRSAKAMNVPINTSTFGADTALNDLEIVAARSQELSYVGQRVPIVVTVKQRGRLVDRTELVLLEGEQELERREVVVPPNGETTVRLEAQKNSGGLYRFQIRAAGHDSEATQANNNATVLLRVTEKPMRVMLLEGKPYWDAKFLIRTLAADPALDVDAIVRVSESRFVRRSLRLPRGESEGEKSHGQRAERMDVLEEPTSFLESPDGLSACQVVILGRDADIFLNDRIVERLRTWVSKEGGSLVCSRGLPVSRASDQLLRLMPVRWTASRESRFRPKLTERGLETEWLSAGLAGGDTNLESLPSLATVDTQERPKPLSVVLATTGDSESPSVIAYQPYGTGRVVALEGSGMWRWAFLAPQYQAHDDVYGALWQNLLRWLVSVVGLVPGEVAAVRTDKVNYLRGEPLTAYLLLREDQQNVEPLRVELTQGSATIGERFTPVPIGEEPGAYRVSLGARAEGTYQLNVVDETNPNRGSLAAAAFDVRPYFREQLDVEARPELMSLIAAETAGTVLEQGTAAELQREFEAHLARSRPLRVRRVTAWDRWWVLAGLVGVWGLAWGLRRSSGLV